MKILVVDDEPFIRELLIETLQPLGHQLDEAADGHSALNLVESFQPAIMVLDVSMPGLDGYAVLDRLRSMEKASRIFVLMLTARAELDDVERGLTSGADDYLAKPFHLRELVARIQAAVRVQTLQEELLLKNRQLSDSLSRQERLNRRMTVELEMAARLQGSILSPMHLDLGRAGLRTRYKPSAAIGGDFYDLRQLDDGRAGIFLADAVGHGVSAALLGAMLKTALDHALADSTSPAMVLAKLNHSFQFCSRLGKYLTAFFAILDCNTGELNYSLAGHVRPLVHRASSGVPETLDTPGYCLGMFEEGAYEERATVLHPGDRLFACTDGFADASYDDRQVFAGRIPALLASSAGCETGKFLERIESALAEFLEGATPADDYTLLCVDMRP